MALATMRVKPRFLRFLAMTFALHLRGQEENTAASKDVPSQRWNLF